uniref:Uncharacterized protein n=1 Tax=Glossina austeni TaxID=7395 RepID=A0A1A9VMV1_GLOAU
MDRKTKTPDITRTAPLIPSVPHHQLQLSRLRQWEICFISTKWEGLIQNDSKEGKDISDSILNYGSYHYYEKEDRREPIEWVPIMTTMKEEMLRPIWRQSFCSE